MKVAKFLFGIVELALLVLIALLVINTARDLSVTSYDFGYRVFSEKPMANAPGQDVLVQVKPGTSHYELAQMLEDKKLCRDSKLFFIQIELSAYRKKITDGTFTLNTSMTPKEMIVILAGQEPAGTESEE